MAGNHIQLTDKGALRIITTLNPSKKNAWNKKCYQDIADALNAAAVDDAVAVVAITGKGEFFSSGNDLSVVNMEHLEELRDAAQKMIIAHIQFPKLLIAVVNGPCIGIAPTTVALCDVVYASETAYFHTPFTSLGLCAEGSSSYTFPQILGKSKASEMLLLNHKLTANEALKFNFVSEVFTQSELTTKLWPRIENFSKLPKNSMLVGKKLMRKRQLAKLEEARRMEMIELYKRLDTDDEFKNALLKFASRKTKSKL